MTDAINSALVALQSAMERLNSAVRISEREQKKALTFSLALDACAIWEAMLEAQSDKKPENQPEWQIQLRAAWSAQGTVTMRGLAVELAAPIDRIWNALSEDERESLIPFDWEFVPFIIQFVDWHTHSIDETEALKAAKGKANG